MPIPDYIRDRLLRPIPPDCCVAPDTYPVIANGDPGLARIATVGLNPGGGAPYNDATAEEVWEGQKRYFQGDDVYRRYFSPLEGVLNACGASYGGKYDPDGNYAISACNLDLVCWATCPRDWSEVPPEAREKLIERDREFLAALLAGNRNIELVLATTKQVVDEMIRSHGADMQEERVGRDRLFHGELQGRGLKVIGWNRPTRFLSKGAKQRVGEIAAERGVRP